MVSVSNIVILAVHGMESMHPFSVQCAFATAYLSYTNTRFIKIKNPYGFLQSNPQILSQRDEPFFSSSKIFFVKHP